MVFHPLGKHDDNLGGPIDCSRAHESFVLSHLIICMRKNSNQKLVQTLFFRLLIELLVLVSSTLVLPV